MSRSHARSHWATALTTLLLCSVAPSLRGAEYQAGEELVTISRTPLKDGKETRFQLEAGVSVTAVETNGPWIAVELDRDGEVVTGWIHQKHLERSENSSAVGAILAEDDVSASRLVTLFRSAHIDAHIDDDGDVKISNNGLHTFIKIDQERKRLLFISLLNTRADVSELDRLHLVNRWNRDLLLVRFNIPEQHKTAIVCDYTLFYQNGICPDQIVKSYERFKHVIFGAVLTQDPDDFVK